MRSVSFQVVKHFYYPLQRDVQLSLKLAMLSRNTLISQYKPALQQFQDFCMSHPIDENSKIISTILVLICFTVTFSSTILALIDNFLFIHKCVVACTAAHTTLSRALRHVLSL